MILFNLLKSLSMPMMRDWPLLKRLLAIETNSFIRSKYVRFTLLHQYVVLIPMAFIFLKVERTGAAEIFLMIWSCFLGAVPALGYTSVCLSKDGFFYQAFVTRNLSFRTYVQGKHLFMLAYAFIYLLCMSPIMLKFPPLVCATFFASILYSVGLGGMIMLYATSFSKHKLNLNASPFLNYEGISIFKTLLVLPIVTPLFFWSSTRNLAIVLMSLLGICGFLSISFAIDLVSRNLARRKYSFLGL